MNQMGEWIFLVLFAGFGLLTFLSIMRTLRKLRAQLEPIANSLGGELVTGLLSGFYIRFPGAYGETRVSLTPGSKNNPPKLSIFQLRQMDFQLRILAEDSLSGVAKKIHLVRELEIGDPLFDQKYLLLTKDREKVQSFLLSSLRREAVDYFFSNGFSEINVLKNMVSAVKKYYTDQDLDPGRIRQDVEQLNRFISG